MKFLSTASFIAIFFFPVLLSGQEDNPIKGTPLELIKSEKNRNAGNVF